MAIHNAPMPPSAWVKSNSQHQHHSGGGGNNMTCAPMNMNCSSVASSTPSAYGAPSSYSQQSFYPESHSNSHHHRYNADGNVTTSGSIRQNANYPTANSSFYPSEPSATPTDYYHHENQFNAFDSVKNHGGNGACVNDESTSSNFYTGSSGNEISSGFYPQSNHHYHHTNHEYQGEYSRLHYSHNQNGSGGNYFSGPSTRPSSTCSSYGHQLISSPDFQHHSSQLPPFRRNSIESFSSEPGDLPYNSKYGTYNNTHITPHHVKRESLTPSTSPWSGEHDSSQGHGYFFNTTSSNNSSQAQTHPNRIPYNSSICHNNNTSNSSSHQQHHHHCESPGSLHHSQTPSTFSKSSCAFEDSNSMTPTTPDGQYKAGPVKHRSLSLSYSGRSVNFENQHFHHQSSSSSVYPVQQHAHTENAGNVSKYVPVSEIRPGSDSGSTPSQMCEESMNSFSNVDHDDGNMDECVTSPGERTSGQSENAGSAISTETNTGEEEDGDGNGANMDVLQTTICPSQSNKSELNGTSDKSCSPINSGCNDSHDNVSDLEEELKKEIQNVSTTTGMSSGTEEERDDRSEDPSTTVKVENEHELSNSSSLALFDTITLNHFSSPAPSEPENPNLDPEDDMKVVEDDEDSLSGISSFSSHHIHHGSCDRSTSNSPAPQKISKRSFSEADKDLVINTSAITAAVAFGGRGRSTTISIPKGWKRELGTTAESHLVFYIRYSNYFTLILMDL